MLTDKQAAETLDRLITNIRIPRLPLAAIHEQLKRTPTLVVSHARPTFRRAYAGAAIVAGIAVVLFSHSLVQGVEQAVDRYRAALEAVGGYAPPKPPEKLLQTMLTEAGSAPYVTAAKARSRVGFALLPPTGLPRDITKVALRVLPTLIYDPALHAWQVGPHAVWFGYDRAGGRSFQILTSQFDSRNAPPGKYMFETTEPASGRVLLIKHDIFEWRNGSQVTQAIDGPGISASEIIAIRQSMYGEPIPGRWPNKPEPDKIETMFPASSP